MVSLELEVPKWAALFWIPKIFFRDPYTDPQFRRSELRILIRNRYRLITESDPDSYIFGAIGIKVCTCSVPIGLIFYQERAS
jgi:hypothetical protein